MPQDSDVTRILSAIDRGERDAAAQLLPLVYDELRKLAAHRLAREKPGQTLQATALVHEAYLRLLDGREPRPWSGRGHFFAAAAEAMRRILVENARRKQSLKGGGGRQREDLEAIELTAADSPVASTALDLLALDEALARLERDEPRKAEVVKLRFFAGLTMPEIAQSLDLSLATVERYWTYARTWLYADLTDQD